MRNKLTPAKTPLPKFASDKQAAEYFENHSVAGIWDQLPEARRVVRATTKTFEKPVSSDEIAAKASRGEDICAYFSNKFTVARPVRRVNVDLSQADVLENSTRGRRGSTSAGKR